jgi:S-DNA-T family DNA segregation ATPase FtsK/SpoIIIE
MDVTLTLTTQAEGSRDIAISARRDVCASEILPMCAGDSVSQADGLFSSGSLLSRQTLLGTAQLRPGCHITDGASREGRQAGSILALRVCSGPDCGSIVPLHRGTHVVGRSNDGGIIVNDPDLSRRHLELAVDLHSVAIRDLGSTNGTYLSGARLGTTYQELTPGQTIDAGNTQFVVVGACEPPAATRPDGAGHLVVSRPPALTASWHPQLLQTKTTPPIPPRPQLHWLTAVIPMAVSIALAMAMHSPALLAFSALGPATMLGAAVSDRRGWRKAKSSIEGDSALAEQTLQADRDLQLQHEERVRRAAHPDAATVLRIAQLPSCRIWERRPASSEFLKLRLGLADQPAQTTISRSDQLTSAGVLADVPAVISLRDRTLGVAGPERQVRALGHWLIAQIAALHSPAEVQFVLVLDECSSERWRWLRWAQSSLASVATTAPQRRSTWGDVRQLLYDRLAEPPAGQRWKGRWLVVVVDFAAAPTELVGLTQVLSHGPQAGITLICLAADRRELPVACGSTACFEEPTGVQLKVEQPDEPSLLVTADLVSLDWADQLARSLAPLRDAEDRGSANVPHHVRLRDVLGAPVDPETLRHKWASRKDGQVPIGVGPTGTATIDLVKDGPHVLIAGTTGSGKSELLRALVTSLAVQHPPGELAFILIDYKGGAAFAECAQFPHVAGLVTDLDARLTWRALMSLDAELRRREQAFNRAKVSDLAGYVMTGEGRRSPLARLVLVIDEFATLAEELPDFLSGLLGVAQRGRSLGVHLVLATQRPAGVLSQDIKANMSLRIALRVTDAAESIDVIGTDHASRISRNVPGRAFARRADGELEEFQCGRVDLPLAPAADVTVREVDSWNNPITRASLDSVETDLVDLQRALIAAAVDLPTVSQPWLDPLPTVLTLDHLPGSTAIALGVMDKPATQQQAVLQHDLMTGGSIGFIGGPRSGRSAALRSAVGRAVAQLNADQLSVHVIDCAGGGLSRITELPHCAASVDASDPYTVSRLVSRLAEEHAARQRDFTASGATDFQEARAAGFHGPAVLVILDGWDAFSAMSEEYDGGRTSETMLQLLRDSGSTGFSHLLAGDRGMLGIRVGSAIGRKLVLPLTDRNDYALAGIDARQVTEASNPGRAIDPETGAEVQLALLSLDVSTASQWDTLFDLARSAPVTQDFRRITVRPLPTRVTLANLQSRGLALDAGECLLGLGGDNAGVIGHQMYTERSRFLICGPTRSGKSTAAALVGEQAVERGLRVTAAASGRSPLSAWARRHGITPITPEQLSIGFDADLLLIDDAEQFSDTTAGEDLLKWVTEGVSPVVVTAQSEDLLMSFRGIGSAMRRYRTGLLLQPSTVDGELLNTRLSGYRTAAVPGRGLLVTDDTRATQAGFSPLQVAEPDWQATA